MKQIWYKTINLNRSSANGDHFLGLNRLAWIPFIQFHNRSSLHDQGFVLYSINPKDVHYFSSPMTLLYQVVCTVTFHRRYSFLIHRRVVVTPVFCDKMFVLYSICCKWFCNTHRLYHWKPISVTKYFRLGHIWITQHRKSHHWKLNLVTKHFRLGHIDGLVQDCSISSVLALELLQSCIKPSIYE